MGEHQIGALAAVVNKKGENVSETALTMLETMSHRGSNAFGVSADTFGDTNPVIRRTVNALRREHVNSSTLIAHCFAENLRRDKPQPIQGENFLIVFDGRLFPAPSGSDAEYVVQKLLSAQSLGAQLVQRFNGAYAFALAKDGAIKAGRDAVGACPLYFGENENVYAVASERKALWKIGVNDAKLFPPGTLCTINEGGFHFEAAETLVQPPVQKLDVETASNWLRKVLFQSTRERVSDVRKVAVAFSGGVDSSTVALLAKLCQVEVHLICVGLKGREETVFAKRAAKALKLPFYAATYSVDDVKATLPKAIWAAEEFNPVSASIAVPLFWVAEQSALRGFRVLLTGQGGDELFAGYHRYLTHYARTGEAGLQKKLFQDVTASHETNFQRDYKICAYHKVELRMPFADLKVINTALRFPLQLKIASSSDPLRKLVLRHTAKKLGIPRFITEKPKKAIQYATGVNKALNELAKNDRLALGKYVEKTFLKTFEMLK